jgi:hypothetical protein
MEQLGRHIATIFLLDIKANGFYMLAIGAGIFRLFCW